MASRTASGEEFDPVTGEILTPTTEETPEAGKAVVPAQTSTLTDVDNLPTDWDALTRYFAEPEPELRDVFKAIMGLGQMEERDPEDTARSIIARIMSATTEEDILKANRVVHAREILGTPIEIIAVKWQRSTFAEGATVYAVVEARQLDAEKSFMCTVGGRNVMAQLLNMQHRGFLPFRAVIQQAAKPTEAGYYPLWMEPA